MARIQALALPLPSEMSKSECDGASAYFPVKQRDHPPKLRCRTESVGNPPARFGPHTNDGECEVWLTDPALTRLHLPLQASSLPQGPTQMPLGKQGLSVALPLLFL